jgi:hypothetical protein
MDQALAAHPRRKSARGNVSLLHRQKRARKNSEELRTRQEFSPAVKDCRRPGKPGKECGKMGWRTKEQARGRAIRGPDKDQSRGSGSQREATTQRGCHPAAASMF